MEGALPIHFIEINQKNKDSLVSLIGGGSNRRRSIFNIFDLSSKINLQHFAYPYFLYF